MDTKQILRVQFGLGDIVYATKEFKGSKRTILTRIRAYKDKRYGSAAWMKILD